MPVILVGNKIDLRGGEVTNEALEDEIIPIMNEFKVSSRIPHQGHLSKYCAGRFAVHWLASAHITLARTLE